MPLASPVPDGQDMLGAVCRLPDQIERTWQAHAGLTLPWRRDAFDAVVVAGMGGSAIGGDLASGLFSAALTAPVVVVRDAALPGWVGPRSLVVATSFSGNTAETHAAWLAAGQRGSLRVAIATGGRLAEAAAEAGAPLLRLPPGGAPRAALGHVLSTVLAVFRAAGVVDDPTAALGEAVQAMRALVAAETHAGRWRQDDAAGMEAPWPSALAVARRIEGRLPILYAAEPLTAVARRWKAQLNENAKLTAAFDTLPEAHHNSVVGYDGPAGPPETVVVVVLEADEPSSAVVEDTCAVLEDRGVACVRLAAPPGHAVSRALWLVQLGDLVSIRLANRRGIDPTPIAAIDDLKERQARRRP